MRITLFTELVRIDFGLYELSRQAFCEVTKSFVEPLPQVTVAFRSVMITVRQYIHEVHTLIMRLT